MMHERVIRLILFDGRCGTCGTLVNMDMETLQYPIGRFLWNVEADPDSRQARLKAIEDTPAELQKVVSDLTEQQLDTPYRPDGWTVRQVVHPMPTIISTHMCGSSGRSRRILLQSRATIRRLGGTSLMPDRARYSLR